VINRDKDKARKGKVLFIEASRGFKQGTTQNYLRDEDVMLIAATYRAFKNVEKYAQVVTRDEIEKNDWNLNISRYVETSDAEQKLDVGTAVAKLREAEKARDGAKLVMDRFLRELGYGEN
jgi:type I restriction enzyme M protein